MQNCLFKETKESSKIFLLLLIKTISQQCVKKNAINLYNEIRLHLSLDYKTPNMVYKVSA